MTTSRFGFRLAAVSICCLLGSCKTLPDMDNATDPAPASSRVTVDTGHGKLAPGKASKLMARRWANATADLKSLAVLEQQATGEPLIAGNKVTLLFDGPATMREMMAAVRAATSTVNLETYIFDQDSVGTEFADLLIEKQKQGVTVNVMYDSIGTFGTPQAFFDRMKAAGIHLLAFNPVNPAAPGKWDPNNRDHRKLMVVDGKIGFTGGVNISADYANSSFFRSHKRPGSAHGKKVGWRDTHIKVEGPAVAPLQWSFINNWISQEAGELPAANYFPHLDPAGDKIVRVLATDPGSGYEIYKSLQVALGEAKKSIHITSAYFVPDAQTVDALRDAAQRGVDVKLVLPGVSDNGVVMHAGQAFYEPLLEAGVKIYQLQVAVLHAKTAVIDSAWSTIGSSNIDRRSFIHNYELNVVVIDPTFGRAMESAFSEDLRDSKEMTLERWHHRPLSDRFKEFMSRLGEYWL